MKTPFNINEFAEILTEAEGTSELAIAVKALKQEFNKQGLKFTETSSVKNARKGKGKATEIYIGDTSLMIFYYLDGEEECMLTYDSFYHNFNNWFANLKDLAEFLKKESVKIAESAKNVQDFKELKKYFTKLNQK